MFVFSEMLAPEHQHRFNRMPWCYRGRLPIYYTVAQASYHMSRPLPLTGRGGAASRARFVTMLKIRK